MHAAPARIPSAVAIEDYMSNFEIVSREDFSDVTYLVEGKESSRLDSVSGRIFEEDQLAKVLAGIHFFCT